MTSLKHRKIPQYLQIFLAIALAAMTSLKHKKIPQYLQIFLAIALAVMASRFIEENDSYGPFAPYKLLEYLGALFINALKMIVIPLIFSSILTSVARISKDKKFGTLGKKTILYYLTTSSIAIIVGLVVVNLMQPGSFTGKLPSETLDPASLEKIKNLGAGGWSEVTEIFLRMFPSNIFNAFAKGNFLAVIAFAILFGYFLSKTEEKLGTGMLEFWEAIYQVMLKITNLVIRFAPIGVFALVAKALIDFGFDTFTLLFRFFITVMLSLAVHFFIVLPLILKFLAKKSPIAYLKALSPALLMAFSTSSSSATLPVTLSCLEKRANINKKISHFVTPIGATVNMDGTALYECAVVLFIDQLYGVEMSIVSQLLVCILALVTSVGVAGVPSASLVAITLILSSLGLPVEEPIAFIWIVDRFLDMTRTAVNVYSDACGVAVIDAITKSSLTPNIAKDA